MDLEKISKNNYQFQNWSKTYSCRPELLFIPETLEEIREILFLAKTEKKRIRVIGCGNSPSDICCSEDYLIDMKNFQNVLYLDQENLTITVQSGINLGKLNKILEENNLAMPILGSISDSTLAGVISVGTHGTGFKHGIIADYVIQIRLIIPSGDIIVCSKQQNQDIFLSVLCGLGALGIILEITIQCVRKFYLHQLQYPSRLDSILERLDENIESCDHFRFLYFPHTDYVSVSITNRIGGPFLNLKTLKLRNDLKRTILQTTTINNQTMMNSIQDELNNNNDHGDTTEIIDPSLLEQYDQLLDLTNPYSTIDDDEYRLDSEKNLLQKSWDWLIQYGIGYHFIQFSYWLSTYYPQLVPLINKFAFWFLYSSNRVQLDLSYKIFNFECLFDQHVNEWSIPRNKTVEALTELKQAIDESTSFYAHFPIEVRFVQQSSIYLAPTYGRDSTYINIICYQPYGKRVDCTEYWKCYESIMKRYGGRPHWAKDHHESAEDFIKMYPYFRAWAQIRKRLDPNRIFFNSYLDRIFKTFPSSSTTTNSNKNINAASENLFLNNNNYNNNTSSSFWIEDDNQDDYFNEKDEIFSSTVIMETSSSPKINKTSEVLVDNSDDTDDHTTKSDFDNQNDDEENVSTINHYDTIDDEDENQDDEDHQDEEEEEEQEMKQKNKQNNS